MVSGWLVSERTEPGPEKKWEGDNEKELKKERKSKANLCAMCQEKCQYITLA